MSLGRPVFFEPDVTARSESACGVRFLFTGREWLAPVGLYDYRHRGYSPILGRFLQVDPVRFIAGWLSFYTYAKNGAAFVSDPMGLMFEIGEPLWDELPRGHEGAARETTAILRAEWESIRHGKYTRALQHLAKLLEKSPEVSVVVRVGRTGGLGSVRQPTGAHEPYVVVIAPIPELEPIKTLVHELVHVLDFVVKRQPCSDFAGDDVVRWVVGLIQKIPYGPNIDAVNRNTGRIFADEIVRSLLGSR